MSQRRYRAWRFAHPDVDAGDGSAGLRILPHGAIDWIDGAASVRQAILLLLSTAPGERVMRPEYGCDLHRLLFSLNDDTTAGLAIHYVRRAIERWEPRVELVHLDATRSAEQPELLDILLEYRVLSTQQVEQIAFSFSLAGEET